MNKEERIARYGEEAYEKYLAQSRAWNKAHRAEERARKKKYNEEHPEEVAACKKKYQEEHKEAEKARVKKYQEEHKEQVAATKKKYREEHPEEVIANGQEQGRKGGKYYDQKLEYKKTGIQGDKNKIRRNHARQYKPYKDIIAPESQIHHEWVPNTSEYRGVALVEADAHMHGFVDVIEILDGKIRLLTEEEVRKND